jgi:hypothetical protein
MSLPSDRRLTDWVVPSDTSALCDAIPVLWQNTDSQILSLLNELLTQSPLSPTTTTITQLSSSPTATGASSNTSSPSNSGLSNGAKAAIGITIPILLIALIAGVFLFFRRRNRNQQEHIELPTSSPSIDGSNWTQLNEMQKLGVKSKASELDSSVRFEADGGTGHHTAELGTGDDVVFELQGSLVDVSDGDGRAKKNQSAAEQ